MACGLTRLGRLFLMDNSVTGQTLPATLARAMRF